MRRAALALRRLTSVANRRLGGGVSRGVLLICIAGTPAVVTACALPVAVMEADVVKGRIPFLREGRTTREEVLNRLGHPTGEYDDGRILIYVLQEDVTDRLHSGPVGGAPNRGSQWRPTQYQLVLVFGTGGVLERQSLVRVR